MDKLNELNKLERWLRENGYKVSRIDYENEHDIADRHQVIVKDDNDERMFDAICQKYSYGYRDGLLEIMNGTLKLTRNDDNDDSEVEGWLTAEEIIKRLKGA